MSAPVWINQMWQQSEVFGAEKLILKVSSFPETFEKLDRFKSLPKERRTIDGFTLLYTTYDRLLSEVQEIRQKATIAPNAYSYRPSVFLDPAKDQRLLEIFPRVRNYHDPSSAGVDIVFAGAQLSLHLDLLQLSALAEPSFKEHIRRRQQRSVNLDRSTFTKCARWIRSRPYLQSSMQSTP